MQAQIRCLLERTPTKVGLFSGAAGRRDVTNESNFGAANRVFPRCSKNPRIQFAPHRQSRLGQELRDCLLCPDDRWPRTVSGPTGNRGKSTSMKTCETSTESNGSLSRRPMVLVEFGPPLRLTLHVIHGLRATVDEHEEAEEAELFVYRPEENSAPSASSCSRISHPLNNNLKPVRQPNNALALAARCGIRPFCRQKSSLSFADKMQTTERQRLTNTSFATGENKTHKSPSARGFCKSHPIRRRTKLPRYFALRAGVANKEKYRRNLKKCSFDTPGEYPIRNTRGPFIAMFRGKRLLANDAAC